ncbi:B12-binding domain-containing radical SAM protein [Actinoplanes sp. NPDC051859]|uniref:B12-binding domain-containing radical SAM protein n=1 Tax=Actinoplanes sp. NPDC051859 TaxID=3363909 RepID=UPI0037A029E5
MFAAVPRTTQDRVSAAIGLTCPAGEASELSPGDLSIIDPAELSRRLSTFMPHRFSLSGTLERRLLLAEEDPVVSRWRVTDLSGQELQTLDWPTWSSENIAVHDPCSWSSPATVSEEAAYRLLRPRVLLVALYHPEHFPLPRFPLAISDLARAARSTLIGQVRLMDMQLGVSLPDVFAEVEAWQPDIVGVSATFGQHDLMIQVLDHLGGLDRPPTLLAGGSLTARNERLLVKKYPDLLIARGAGEATVQDVIAHWHGDLSLPEVRGIGYHGAASGGGLTIGTFRRTAAVGNRRQTEIFPELDLLDATFRHRGVAQLETSRGCTNYCSFCPRGHKGVWSGSTPEQLPWILSAMREVFDQHPEVSRTLYLVDEEFIGRDDGAADRAIAVAQTVHHAGFRWETSCRIDQVVWPAKDRAWHVRRAQMWRDLLRAGLRRCLFGVESGVTSVLERFNKETTGEQNALAIRSLSALGVPTRYTYITFDPLMNRDELQATYDFQGRRDLLLRPLPHLSVEQIVDGVHDEGFVREHAIGRPLHQGISYMLVSMECLIGAAYTRTAQTAGLTREPRPSMGRVDAVYADWRIGVASHHAQLWIDRNFALDYTLKSLEKVLDGTPRHSVRGARTVLKGAAYDVLGDMLTLIDFRNPEEPAAPGLAADLIAAMDDRVMNLRDRLTQTIADVAGTLPPKDADRLTAELGRWTEADTWRLINAADPCGT